MKEKRSDKFKEFAENVAAKFEKPIKSNRSDNGREYISGELEILLKQMGITHQKTAPYSPQQNGVAERKNRSWCDMAKCMLLDAGVENRYWAQGITTANYIYNRLPII